MVQMHSSKYNPSQLCFSNCLDNFLHFFLCFFRRIIVCSKKCIERQNSYYNNFLFAFHRECSVVIRLFLQKNDCTFFFHVFVFIDNWVNISRENKKSVFQMELYHVVNIFFLVIICHNVEFFIDF
jgi:hypothetical protein